MPFEPAGSFIFTAAKKYNLHKQAASGLVLESVRRVFEDSYLEYSSFWQPQKFENGKLSIHTKNSAASSVLFMKTHEIIEKLNQNDLPQKVREINIIKN